MCVFFFCIILWYTEPFFSVHLYIRLRNVLCFNICYFQRYNLLIWTWYSIGSVIMKRKESSYFNRCSEEISLFVYDWICGDVAKLTRTKMLNYDIVHCQIHFCSFPDCNRVFVILIDACNIRLMFFTVFIRNLCSFGHHIFDCIVILLTIWIPKDKIIKNCFYFHIFWNLILIFSNLIIRFLKRSMDWIRKFFIFSLSLNVWASKF